MAITNVSGSLGSANPSKRTRISQIYNPGVQPPQQDQYFKNTTLLLAGNGTNGTQNNTFLDSSTNNFTVTRNGNPTQGSFTPYGERWSNYFDGSGDELDFGTNADFQFGSATNATIDVWVYSNDTSAFRNIAGYYYYVDGEVEQGWHLSMNAGGAIRFRNANAGGSTTTSAISANTWVRVTVTITSGTVQIYLNGVASGGTFSFGSCSYTNARMAVGAVSSNGHGASSWTGYLSNMRIIVGSVVIPTAGVGTAPLTAVSGTELLTCQSNRFIDNSTNAASATVYGSPSVQCFQPFLFNTSYTPSTIGGSGYFDGSGDYLSTGSSANLQPGSSDFCVEAWVYPTVVGTSRYIYSANDNTPGTNLEFRIAFSSSGIFANYWADGSYISQLSTATPLVANQWSHIAWCRSGSTISLFVNGVRMATDTISGGSTASTAYAHIGQFITLTGYYLTGNMSDLRFVKGSSVYTPSSTTLTVPTTPLTAITNTQLLLGYTNAGIVDNAMMNDMETLGNAQISTSVKKYGTGSMYFDGSSDWLAFPVTPQWSLGTGDFTVELWVYFASSSRTSVLVGNGGYNSISDNVAGWSLGFNAGGAYFGFNTGTTGNWFINNDTGLIASTFPSDTWIHVAATRQSGSLKCFINGVQLGSTITAAGDCSTSSYVPRVGTDAYTSSGYYLNGYIDDLRITKGVARYTENFTPPTEALPTY